MHYIEKCIKNTWDEIPPQFKERVKDYRIVVTPNSKAKRKQNDICFGFDYLDSKIQSLVDKIVIDAISLNYGFTEEEANIILSTIKQRKV